MGGLSDHDVGLALKKNNGKKKKKGERKIFENHTVIREIWQD